MVLWDIEWIDADGTAVTQQYDLTRQAADHQAQQWLEKKPHSRVYLYRRRGATSVLVQIVAETGQTRARDDR